MRILFLGDVVGGAAVDLIRDALPALIDRERLDLVIANAENAAAGSGMTAKLYRRLRHGGVDLVTLGDHIYRKDEVFTLFERTNRLCRPANFPPDAPGAESALVEARDGTPVGGFTGLGRTYMRPVDCPFRAADRVLDGLQRTAKVIVVDVHAEATSDKQLMGRHLDGRVTAVLGTHTHVPTADEGLLAGGTAFQCDVGMTGPYDSILGRRVECVMETTLTFNPTHFDVAHGDVRLCGTIVDVDPATGRALGITRLRVDAKEAEELAALVRPVPASD